MDVKDVSMDVNDAVRMDGSDGNSQGYTNVSGLDPCPPHHSPVKGRPTVAMPVDALSDTYSMNHGRRGVGVILAHKQYKNNYAKTRDCADKDAAKVKEALEAVGFEVEEYWDKTKQQTKDILLEVSQRDHSDCDGLAVVFMSHGGVRHNKEYLHAWDTTMDTLELWVNFTAEKCASLAGKPKLFFIQACRGEDADRGVSMLRGLRVVTDSISPEPQDQYTLPVHADQLVMWASYPGLPAFKTQRDGIEGSVFLHFLARALKDIPGSPQTPPLSSLLLRVTREVAVHFESQTKPGESLHANKQVPFTHSTLLRECHLHPPRQ